MVISVANSGLRLNSPFTRADGLPFKGTIEPDLEGKIIGYDFTFPRKILRVSMFSQVKTGDIILDLAKRRFLLADHEIAISRSQIDYRAHLLIPLYQQVVWKRGETEIDQITGLEKGSKTTNLGTHWMLLERVNREYADPELRIKQETYTVLTNQKLQLNDTIDGRTVKRVSNMRGITLAEIQ